MASLLDFLPSGPSNGGLLDFLRQNANAAMANNPGAMASDQAQYGAPAYSAPSQAMAQYVPQNPPAVMSAQPQAAPQAQPAAMPSGPGVGDRLLNGMESFANSHGLLSAVANGIGSLVSGQRTDPTGIAQQMLQQQQSARFQALREAGYSARESMLGALDQKAFEQMAPQAFGGEPYKTAEYTNPANGIKSTMQWNPDKNRWEIVNPAGAPTGTGSAQPGQFGNSPPIAPPPAGANVPEYIKGASEAAAKDNADVQTKAEGAVKALQVLTRLKDRVNAADPHAFGAVLGSPWGQTVQAVADSLPFGPHIGAQQSELQGLYNDLGSSMLKARYGSRITNIDVKQGMKIVGGLESPSKDAALKTLDNNQAEAYDAIAEGIKRGVVNPQTVLQRPQTAEQAKALGPGALYLAPDGSVRRNPQ